MKKAILIGSALCTLLFTNCKKDKKDDPTPSNKSKTQLLTQHPWKLVSSTADVEVDTDGDGNFSTDIYSQKKECERDDIINFSNSDGSSKTGSKSQGATKCDSSDPESVTFNWSFNDVETVLTIKALFFTVEEYSIQELGENTLKVYYSTKDKSDKTYKGTDVYEKP